MKMKGRKATAFIVVNGLISAIVGVVLWRTPSSITGTVLITAIGAILLNAAIFIGGNTLDKVMRMKYPYNNGGGPNAG